MRKSYRIVSIVAAAAVLLAVVPGAEARTRKGDKFLNEGRKAEQRKQWDQALELYEQALAEDPADAAYQIATRRVRFQAAQAHVNLGLALRSRGDLEQALTEFQKAYAIDPSSVIAEQELRRTLEVIERLKKQGASAKPDERSLTAAELARKEELEKIARIQSPPELKPLSRQAINLRMTNQPPRVLYETVGKLAGINVVFDADAQELSNRRYSVELSNATLEDALDYLSTMTRTFWKALSPNAIFVTMDNQQKRREYEDSAVRVFYLNNLTTPQELTELTTMFRTVAGVKNLMQFNSLNAVVVRGTPDQISLSQKLVNDLDKPRAEVVVDVLVMEANRAKTRGLAATIASGGQPGLDVPILFTPRNPVLLGGDENGDGDTTGVTGGLLSGAASASSQLISLARIARISTNDFSITLPGALLRAVMTDRNTKVMQSPQVRAASGQKATLRIGDKVPVASGGMQPFGGTVGGFSSLYSQFQFIDVGVNVDITPIVHGSDEVTLKVMLEISNVRDRIDLGGISQPVIGQRRVEHEIRIKEGEASLLGGLMQEQDTRAISGIPGLANIPVVKRLFSSESIEKGESELLIALIPHIVRTPGITDMNVRSVAAGSEAFVKLSYRPRAEDATAAEEVAKAVTAVPGTTPAPEAQPAPAAPEAQPAPAPAAPPAAEQPGPPAPPTPEAAEPAPPVAPPGAATRLMLRPDAVQVQSGSVFSVTLEIENARDLFAAPFHLKFDPQLLRLNDVRAGGFLSADGQNIIFTRNILNDTGDATVNLNRMPGAAGVSGSGALAVFTFQAVKPGTAAVTFSQFGPRDSQQQPVQAAPPQAAITIR